MGCPQEAHFFARYTNANKLKLVVSGDLGRWPELLLTSRLANLVFSVLLLTNLLLVSLRILFGDVGVVIGLRREVHEKGGL